MTGIAGRAKRPGDPLLVGLAGAQCMAVVLAHADCREGKAQRTLEAIASMRQYEAALTPKVRVQLLALEALAQSQPDRRTEASDALIRSRELFAVEAPTFLRRRTTPSSASGGRQIRLLFSIFLPYLRGSLTVRKSKRLKSRS